MLVVMFSGERGREPEAEHGGAGGLWVRWDIDRPETGDVPKKGEQKRQRQWPERIWEAQNHDMHIRHSGSRVGLRGAQQGCDRDLFHLTSTTSPSDRDCCLDGQYRDPEASDKNLGVFKWYKVRLIPLAPGPESSFCRLKNRLDRGPRRK